MSAKITKAAIGDGKGGFTIETTEVNLPKEGEVLIKIKASGVCHTDHDSLNWGRPIVLGHEGAGIVESIGSGVDNVKVGDHVVLNWAIPCKSCYPCQNGSQHICESHSPVVANDPLGGHAHQESTLRGGVPIERAFHLGTLSEYTVVKKEAVNKIDSNIPFSSACIVGCGVMTGVGSAINAAKVTPGSSVVVIGAGGVGLNIIQGAKVAGATQIIAIDINENRLKLAQEFGATEVIQAERDDKGLLCAAEEVKKRCSARGADFAFESTALPELGAAPLAMIRNAGVAVQASGIEQEITFDMNLFEWDKTYINPLYGMCQPDRDIPRIFDLYQAGKLKLDELVTRTYSLDSLDQAFHDMLKGRNAKGVILFD